MKIKLLEWDTDFFGIKTGKVEISNNSEFNPSEFKKLLIKEKFHLVYVFSYGSMLPAEVVSKGNIGLLDILLTMSLKFDKNTYSDIPFKLYNELSEIEKEQCYRIAEQIAVVSRFYKETCVGSEKTKELYKKWIDNALNNTVGDGILLEKNNNSVSGIHIIKTDFENRIGKCSLIGTDSTMKGLGIGKSLWNQAFGYWAKSGTIDFCQVPFSILNTESFGFHLKLGFNKIEEVKYIYHSSNNNLK